MAYYDKFSDKRPNKRDDWRDDGRTRRPQRDEDGAGTQEKERRPYGERPQQGERRPYGERPQPGERRPYGERPQQGERRPYGERPQQGERRPYGERPQQGERRPYGERPQQGERRPYGERPQQGERRPYGERPQQGERRPYGERPQPARPAPIARPFEEEEALPRENLLVGRNPIREALKSGRDIEKLLVARGELIGSAREIVAMAKEQHVVVQEVDRARLDAVAPNHQGLVAFASAYRYSSVEEILEAAKAREEAPFLVILDGVTDPHNLGAVIRSAECAGAHGVIIPERRAVGLTPAAVKASAGAVEYVKVARVTNISRLIEELKKQGIWVYAAAMDGERYDRCDFTGPAALVIGGEGEGVSRLVLEKCDRRVALPMLGKIDSLNASVAAGILMYEIVRSRLK